MKRILMVSATTIILLWSTTPITARAVSRLQTRSFRTNLVKGEYVEAEAVSEEPDESVDDELIGAAEEIITDVAEIAEPQDFDEHTDVSIPTDIESAVDDGELEETIETDTAEPDETIEEYTGEAEEEHETEVQGSE